MTLAPPLHCTPATHQTTYRCCRHHTCKLYLVCTVKCSEHTAESVVGRYRSYSSWYDLLLARCALFLPPRSDAISAQTRCFASSIEDCAKKVGVFADSEVADSLQLLSSRSRWRKFRRACSGVGWRDKNCHEENIIRQLTQWPRQTSRLEELCLQVCARLV